MRSAAVLALLGATTAITISHRRNEHGPKLSGRATKSLLVKTHGDESAAYMVNVTVGTPPQKMQLVVAPSSPYTWVPNAEGYYCSQKSGCRWGSCEFSFPIYILHESCRRERS
jgi:aspartyl protease